MVTQDVSMPARVAQLIGRKRIFRDFFELAIVAVAFLLYFLVRGSVVDRTGEAFDRAVRIIDLERDLGFFWELELQTLILGKDALIQFFNAVYFWLDFPLIAVVGIWMYFWRRHQYTITRDAILASGAIALIIYHLFPVAPPRLVPGFGFVDTLADFSSLSYQAQSTAPFVNPYAAVPSLHVGWAVLLALGIMWSVRNKFVWFLAALLPVAQMAAIVFTANHFIFDAIVGVVVSLMGLIIAFMVQRWGYAKLKRWWRRKAMQASAQTS
jgi:hypothetical protein